MAARAVRCFREQSYPNKRLYIYDTGHYACTDSLPDGFPGLSIDYHRGLSGETLSIGALRNRANWWGVRGSSNEPPDADIILHWDDDDYSHPARIAEQVELLQASGADSVGYSQTLFWDTNKALVVADPYGEETPSEWPGEAWIYSGSPIGASLCYWRRTWERIPFEDVSRGEDDRFVRKIKTTGGRVATCSGFGFDGDITRDYPRMIHHIHGGNTWTPDYAKAAAHGSTNWRRAVEWDAYCERTMAP